jgi:hypothetical protein
MMDKTGLGLFSFHCHTKRFNDKVFGNSLPQQGIAHDLAVKEVLMGGTVEPSFIGRNIGEIADPDPVR